ncbi:amino acid ABC transporter permease [Pimelobacter simplex]|uniref:amino acid ABC transporter permease n=1 Tax=Nocardioides simplex TaxID=2045 RepID=UPI0008E2611D|nr:amino acid ABC transporter permease [Pimelobacter simplex]GEB15015.1 polar amino acid ABC transporter permease [Pimelobacter simplex]SFM87556.1 amino acid ABC transporter membrane protein, PAAT family [Pimelobacter simplex]
MTATPVTDSPARPAFARDARVVVPTRHPGRWAMAAVILVLVAGAITQVIGNERFQWDVVGDYLFAEPILQGVARTLMLTVAAMTIGVVLGVVVAVLRLSPNPILSSAAWAYSWFFRGTPLLVQLLFWYFLGALYPTIGAGSFSWSANDLISPLTAALLGLGLNEAAYMSEIVRGGILSVPPGQAEAASAVGMRRSQVMRRVVLPQAMRVIIPPTGNETIGMLKHTALVLVIGYSELMTSASLIYSRTYQTIPLLIVAALWYLAISAVLSVGQFFIERHFGRGFSHHRVSRRGSRATRKGEAVA